MKDPTNEEWLKSYHVLPRLRLIFWAMIKRPRKVNVPFFPEFNFELALRSNRFFAPRWGRVLEENNPPNSNNGLVANDFARDWEKTNWPSLPDKSLIKDKKPPEAYIPLATGDLANEDNSCIEMANRSNSMHWAPNLRWLVVFPGHCYGSEDPCSNTC